MMVRKIKPPPIGKWLLSFFLNYRHPETVLADFEEVYHDIARTRGVFHARLWYWLQVVLTVPSFAKNTFYWSIAMFENYMKIALRNIKKHKVYSFINIVGLSIGLAAVIFLLLYVQFEISFDRYHKKADRIYRVLKSGIGSSGMSPSMPAPLAPAIEEEFPEVEQVTRFAFRNNVHISADDKNFFEDGFVFTDPATFEIFSFEFLRGRSNTALIDPFSILLSESMAVKYFGSEDPVGRTITYRGTYDFRVTGVLKDLPENSTFTLNFIVPFKTLEKMSRVYDLSSWGAFSYHTYVLLDEEADPRELEMKFPDLIEKHLNKAIAQQVLVRFQGLRNIYLDSRRTVITLFTAIAGLILIIACINYINLATARSAQRMKEIGIRKVVGANRTQLVRQFLGESVLFTLLAFVLAASLVSVFLPSFNTFVGRNLHFNLLENRGFLVWLVALIVLVGLFAGGYPALAISSRKPAHIIRGQVVSSKGSTLRNILVIFQFIVSILLLVSTLVIKGQLHYIRTRDMGFRKDRILVVDIRDKRLRKNMGTLQNELKRNPNILNVSASVFLPNFTDIATTISWPGKPEEREQMMYLNFADYNFIDLYGIEIVEGRNFSRDFPTDADGTFLLNETAVKAIGWESAPGKELTHHIGGRTGKVVGIVKDFHMNSLHQAIEPLCIDLNPRMADSHLSVQITGNQMQETISFIQENLTKFAPGYPFVYQHFEDIFHQAYAFEQKLDTIFSLFSMLAIIVACLGLLGLASFAVQQRIKEIGIRKVLGASVSEIVLLLSRQFTKWVLIANLIAWPMAYFAMERSLQLYAYRIRIGPGFFLLAGGFALFVALMTVSTQAFKAARTNPVDSLRYE
jgi:putative ABC transport system permease protein